MPTRETRDSPSLESPIAQGNSGKCRGIRCANKFVSGFTEKYNVTKLVYFEEHSTIMEAGQREKQLKKWARQWKLDLYDELIREEKMDPRVSTPRTTRVGE